MKTAVNEMEEGDSSNSAVMAPLSTKPPRLLSFIMGARNDAYMGNFTWRMETSLNYLGDNLRKLGRLTDVEVVITDWGSEVPLHTVLSLNSAARQIVRFIVVPPALARDLQGDSEFPIVLAQNTAIRRSRGEYIAQTDSDILFTTEFLSKLFEILDGHQSIGCNPEHALIVAKRRHVPWEFVSRSINVAELDWFIWHFGHFLPMDSLKKYGFGATGMMMMSWRLWQECRGYDERLIHWGWMEIDLGLRITRRYPWFDLKELGANVFHLEHYPSTSPRKPTRKRNPMVCDNSFRPNNENWGLAGYPLEVFDYPHDEPDGLLVGYSYPGRVGWEPALLGSVVRVMWGSVCRWLEQTFDRWDVARWLLACMRKGKRRMMRVWGIVRDHPVANWPMLFRGLWREYERHREQQVDHRQ